MNGFDAARPADGEFDPYYGTMIDLVPDEPVIAFLEEQRPLDGKATAYVCQNHACSLPTSDLREMVSLIDEATGGSQ